MDWQAHQTSFIICLMYLLVNLWPTTGCRSCCNLVIMSSSDVWLMRSIHRILFSAMRDSWCAFANICRLWRYSCHCSFLSSIVPRVLSLVHTGIVLLCAHLNKVCAEPYFRLWTRDSTTASALPTSFICARSLIPVLVMHSILLLLFLSMVMYPRAVSTEIYSSICVWLVYESYITWVHGLGDRQDSKIACATSVLDLYFICFCSTLFFG